MPRVPECSRLAACTYQHFGTPPTANSTTRVSTTTSIQDLPRATPSWNVNIWAKSTRPVETMIWSATKVIYSSCFQGDNGSWLLGLGGVDITIFDLTLEIKKLKRNLLSPIDWSRWSSGRGIPCKPPLLHLEISPGIGLVRMMPSLRGGDFDMARSPISAKLCCCGCKMVMV